MPDNRRGPVITGLGNPLVDILARVEAEAIARHRLTPGGMHLIEAEAADALYREVGPGERQSGGSVANSVAHMAGESVSPCFVGKVGRDDLGEVFAGEFAELDIAFDTPRHETVATGRCVVLMTPDGERTMSTYLGAAQHLGPRDVAASMPDQTSLVFIEGYLWDSPEGAEVIAEGARRARAIGARIAMTPSDSMCVERNAAAMRAFVEAECDILIGNADEVGALSGATTASASLEWARAHVATAAVTMSGEGALIADADGTAHVPAAPIAQLVDSTGAGDAFAAGFLAQLVNGRVAKAAAEHGAVVAARVVQHTGARQRAAAAA